MTPQGSVSQWIHRLKDGDPAAAQPLWEAYYPRLVALALDKLRGARRRAEDEEDAALGAFDSFFRGVQKGRFPRLDDRDDLWRLLVTITACKAHDINQKERRVKRGGGAVRGESVFHGAEDDGNGWERIVGDESTPAFAAEMAENVRRLLGLLRDDELRKIAVWKMEGDTNEDIAARLDCSLPKVERRLKLIRKTWEGEGNT